jgi:signal transduction histidine kinase
VPTGPTAAIRTTTFQLTAAFVAVFVATSAAIVAGLFWQTNTFLTRLVVDSLIAEVDGLRALAQSAGPGAIAEAVSERSKSSEAKLYFLADEQGRKLAGSLNRWPPELEGSTPGGLFTYAGPGGPADERIAVGVPVVFENGQLLVVARDIEDQRAFIEHVRRWFLGGFGIVALLGLAAGIGASRLILGRIALITATSDSIMAGDLSRRIPVTGSGDELDQLALSLNSMLERIEQLMAGLREVSDNIAHDLKTPLNRLRNRAEAAMRSARDAEGYRAGLERTIEEADELIKTFNALLLIARLEAGAIEETLEVFDLSKLLRDIVELYEPLAEESGLKLALTSAPDTNEICANRQLIGQAIANLLDNAVKYGRPGERDSVGHRVNGTGDIMVALRRSSTANEIIVADRGPGIPTVDRDRAVRRFVRLEASRTRPGTGLGLSLVAAVARLHGGRLRLEDNGPGLRAILSLPDRLSRRLPP